MVKEGNNILLLYLEDDVETVDREDEVDGESKEHHDQKGLEDGEG